MFRSVDPELLTSYTILIISVALSVGYLLEYTQLHSNGIYWGIIVGGSAIILYGIGVSVFVLTR